MRRCPDATDISGFVDETVERAHLRRAVQIHERLCGSKPAGWYLGRCSPNSLRIVKEEGDFEYCADSYADDLPYWDLSHGKPLLMVP